MSKLTKHTGGKEVTVYEELDAFLNEEAENILIGAKKIETKQAADISQMRIQLISDEIIPLNTPTGETMLCLGIAKLDSKLYGYIFRPLGRTVHVEELHMNKTRTEIKGSFIVEDFIEWTAMSNFFERENLLEYNRIINWVISKSVNDPQSMNNIISKMAWLEKVNKKLESKYKDPLSVNEIAVKSMRNISVPVIGQPTPGRNKPRKAR